MKPIVLNMIAPPAVRYFGEAAAPAAPATPPPAAPPDPGAPPADADLMAFEAPNIADALADIGATPPGDIETPPAPPKSKEEPPKKEDKPPAPPKTDEPPVKLLRAELDAVKKERDELQKKVGEGDPRVKELDTELASLRTQIADRDKKVSEYERKLAIADPAVTKELRELDDGYNKLSAKFQNSVPELGIDAVNALVQEYHRLPFGKPEYREKFAEFENRVNMALGAADGAEHRKLSRALEFIEQTHEFAVERPKLQKRIQDNALKLQNDAKGSEFSASRTFVADNIAKAKGIPEGLKERDPYHPKIMLADFESKLPPDQLAAYQKGLPEFIELVFAGPKPFNEADFVGQSPEAIQQSLATQRERHEVARGQAVDVIFNGLRALRLLPTLVKDWQRLKAKVKEEDAAAPPDPSSKSETPPAPGDDLATLQTPEIPEF